MNDKIPVCIKHVDMAIEDFVNKYESAPELAKVQNGKCEYCDEDAEYIIMKPHSFL